MLPISSSRLPFSSKQSMYDTQRTGASLIILLALTFVLSSHIAVSELVADNICEAEFDAKDAGTALLQELSRVAKASNHVSDAPDSECRMSGKSSDGKSGQTMSLVQAQKKRSRTSAKFDEGAMDDDVDEQSAPEPASVPSVTAATETPVADAAEAGIFDSLERAQNGHGANTTSHIRDATLSDHLNSTPLESVSTVQTESSGNLSGSDVAAHGASVDGEAKAESRYEVKALLLQMGLKLSATAASEESSVLIIVALIMVFCAIAGVAQVVRNLDGDEKHHMASSEKHHMASSEPANSRARPVLQAREVEVRASVGPPSRSFQSRDPRTSFTAAPPSSAQVHAETRSFGCAGSWCSSGSNPGAAQQRIQVLSKQPSAAAPPEKGTADCFCHDLIVPQFCECILVIPIGKMNRGPFDVTDTNGSVVLHVVPRDARASFPVGGPQPTFGPGVSQASLASSSALQGQLDGFRAFSLTTSQGHVLAQCRAARAASVPGSKGGVEFQLSRAGENSVFAWLRRSENQDYYVLTTVAGLRLHFWGSFEHYAVNITDDQAKLLATTEVCHVDFDAPGKYYRLRVAPLTDIGLVLCSLLCIHQSSDGQPS